MPLGFWPGGALFRGQKRNTTAGLSGQQGAPKKQRIGKARCHLSAFFSFPQDAKKGK
jgi:hypothetical protein